MGKPARLPAAVNPLSRSAAGLPTTPSALLLVCVHGARPHALTSRNPASNLLSTCLQPCAFMHRMRTPTQQTPGQTLSAPCFFCACILLHSAAALIAASACVRLLRTRPGHAEPPGLLCAATWPGQFFFVKRDPVNPPNFGFPPANFWNTARLKNQFGWARPKFAIRLHIHGTAINNGNK